MDNVSLQRGMPAAIEAERFVIGSILARGSELFEQTDLKSDDFAIDKHRRIWTRIESLHEKGEPIDHVMLAHELMRFNELESIDGLSYLVSLQDGIPLIPSIDAYVRVVREKANCRRGALIMQHGLNRFLAAEEDSENIISATVSSLEEIDTDGQEAEWQTASDIIREYPGGWQALVSPAAHGNAAGIPLPWPRVQQIVCGLQKGELIIVAGRPSMGKSALAMQMAMYAAHQGAGVAYVSLEMTGPALVRREVSQEARVDSVKMRLGYLGMNERTRLVEAREQIEALPVNIESRQRRGRTSASITASLRYLKSRQPLGLVVIDHFHLIDGPERDERIKYNRIADALQRSARDMGIPFVVLAQLNRKCEEERREPGLPDLKECGKLEENADVVMFIHRPEMYAHLRDREDLRGVADLIVAKQRDGATGKAQLVFLSQQTRFESRAEDIGGDVQ